MPDLPISNLPEMGVNVLEGTDELAIADNSASETKRIRASRLVQEGINALADGSIDSNKLSTPLPADSVDEAAIQNGAVTDDKVSDGIDGSKISDGTISANELGVDSVTTNAVQDAAITDAKIDSVNGSKIQANSIPDGKFVAGAIRTADIGQNQVTGGATGNIALNTITDDNISQITSGVIQDGTIDSDALGSGSVTTDKLADGAVTDDKLATGIDGGKLLNKTVDTDQIADSAIETLQLADGSVTDSKVTAVSGSKITTGTLPPGANQNTTAAAQFLAGPTTSAGAVTARTIDGDDLPTASDTDKGAVLINGEGLRMDGTQLEIDNDVTAESSNYHVVQYDEKGLVTGGRVMTGDDMPIATATDLGVVKVPGTGGLSVDGDGNISTGVSITGDTKCKITYNANGLVTAGADLTAADLPADIPAENISSTSGKLPTADATPEQGFDKEIYTTAIEDESISRRHFSDISTAYIQESQPTSTSSANTDATVFRGCLWFRESTGQLYMFNGNAWHIVAGGQLTQENLRFCGTYNATNNTIVALTDEGVAEQKEDGTTAFTVGQAVPNCDDKLSGCYFVIETAGSALTVNDVNGNNFAVGDLLLGISTSSGWVQVGGAFGGGGGSGDSHWSRSGASPNARLTPTQSGDNLYLQGGNWMTLPHGSGAGAPDGGEGSVRWNATDNTIEVWDGSTWQSNAKKSNLQWETIAAGDNADWAQDIVRPVASTSDIAVRPARSLVFEDGTPSNSGSSGDTTSQLQVDGSLTASRTWTLPNESGTLVTRTSTVDQAADTLTIDCGTY